MKDKGISVPEIKAELTSLQELTRKCYVISYYSELDGQTLHFNEAFSKCIGRGMPSIILLSKKAAVIETEQVAGPAIKFILYNKNI